MLQNPSRKKPLSARKRAAIMANLAKARAAPRTAEGRARSSRNATRHGMFVRNFEESIQRLGENRRQFLRLGGLLARIFLPRDATEWRLVRRLAEVTWPRPDLAEFHLKLVAAASAKLADPLSIVDAQRRELLRRLREAQRAAMGEPDGSAGGLLLEGIVLRLRADLRWLEACERNWSGRKGGL